MSPLIARREDPIEAPRQRALNGFFATGDALFTAKEARRLPKLAEDAGSDPQRVAPLRSMSRPKARRIMMIVCMLRTVADRGRNARISAADEVPRNDSLLEIAEQGLGAGLTEAAVLEMQVGDDAVVEEGGEPLATRPIALGA